MASTAQRGYTLIELITTVAVIAVVSAAAVPAWNDMAQKRRIVSAAEAVYSRLALARSETQKRSETVYVVYDDADPANWALGVSEDDTCDPKTANSCVLIYKEADGTDSSKERVTNSDDFSGVTMTAPTKTTFDPVRGTASPQASVILNTDDYEVRVVIAAVGRIRICSPNLGRYPSCS